MMSLRSILFLQSSSATAHSKQRWLPYSELLSEDIHMAKSRGKLWATASEEDQLSSPIAH